MNVHVGSAVSNKAERPCCEFFPVVYCILGSLGICSSFSSFHLLILVGSTAALSEFSYGSFVWQERKPKTLLQRLLQVCNRIIIIIILCRVAFREWQGEGICHPLELSCHPLDHEMFSLLYW